MNYKSIRKLPTTRETNQGLPVSDSLSSSIYQHRREIENILAGLDDRLIIIVGPCSAWPKQAVIDYAKNLAEVNKSVKHKLKIIMRAYVQKPRTRVGWLGPGLQPDPFSPPDITAGTRFARDMMIQIVELGLPIASEILFPQTFSSLIELVSWACIGARSTENQEHRVLASGLNMPVGFKNPTHGDLDVGVNSLYAAQHSHVAIINNHEVHTYGNQFAHAVLRGANGKPNYDIQTIKELCRKMEAQNINHPAILIDASHDNCIFNGTKNHLRQIDVVDNVLDSLEDYPQYKKAVKGFMLESFIEGGRQDITKMSKDSVNLNGLSITDPCLNWHQTEVFFTNLMKKLTTKHNIISYPFSTKRTFSRKRVQNS